MESLLFLGVLFALMWAFMILPQQRRLKRHAELVASITVGDELLTTSGIYGKVADVFDDDLFLEIAPGVEIRIASGAVATKIEFDDESSDATGDIDDDDEDQD